MELCLFIQPDTIFEHINFFIAQPDALYFTELSTWPILTSLQWILSFWFNFLRLFIQAWHFYWFCFVLSIFCKLVKLCILGPRLRKQKTCKTLYFRAETEKATIKMQTDDLKAVQDQLTNEKVCKSFWQDLNTRHFTFKWPLFRCLVIVCNSNPV